MILRMLKQYFYSSEQLATMKYVGFLFVQWK